MSRHSSAEGKVGEAGFSLIEMLVAISILALVLAMLPGTFSLAHRTWDATAVLDHQARQDSGRSFLQARLTEAMPIFEPVGSGAVRLVFIGSAEALSFVAPSANGPQGAGLYRFSLEVKPQGGARHNALAVAVAPYVSARPRDGDGAMAEEHVLYDDVTSATFRYFGRKEPRGTSAWQTEWTRRDALPDAVELSITSGRSVRTILIPLRLRNAS
jgi:general secretion pathway protein J